MSSSSVQNCALKVSILVINLIASVSSQNENYSQCPEQCVEIQKCTNVLNSLQEEYQKGPITNEYREMLQKLQCGWETDKPKICCMNFEKKAKREFPKSDNNEILIDYMGIELFPNKEICGLVGKPSNKILGGDEADIDEFPWMALLAISKGSTQRYHCGGALINNRYVITAAHCVQGKEIKFVRLGEWDLRNLTDCVQQESQEIYLCNDPPVDVTVEKQIIHPYYKVADHSNDIALLRLATEINYTQWIRPICLPFASKLRTNEYNKERLTIAGWGRTETRQKSSRLLKLKLIVEKFEDCSAQYNNANYTLTNRQMCAGGVPGKDSCSGDSGGPLMSLVTEEKYQNWYISGITSYGPAVCATPDWAGIYTRVGSYIDWILSQVEK